MLVDSGSPDGGSRYKKLSGAYVSKTIRCCLCVSELILLRLSAVCLDALTGIPIGCDCAVFFWSQGYAKLHEIDYDRIYLYIYMLFVVAHCSLTLHVHPCVTSFCQTAKPNQHCPQKFKPMVTKAMNGRSSTCWYRPGP